MAGQSGTVVDIRISNISVNKNWWEICCSETSMKTRVMWELGSNARGLIERQ
jgi:hypothetical protein